MKSYKDIQGDGGSNVLGQVEGHIKRLNSRISGIKHIVAVMSGKGGVGKSSVTVNLASALTLQGSSVGILDADINGPSVAKMTGCQNQKLRNAEDGLLPALGFLNLKIMSMDLFLDNESSPVIWEAPTQKDAYTWRGMMEMTAVREFISDTCWDKLDYLMVDLPPGTEKLPNLVDLLPGLAGTIIVTIPAGVSQFIVGKSVFMANSVLNTPVIGLIENMSGYYCSHCGEKDNLFPEGNTEQLALKHGVPFLGRIPFDSRLALCADSGTSFMETYATSRTAGIMQEIAEKINRFVA